MQSWRKTWREGFAPQISTEGLQSLQTALETDDPRLLQGMTTTPPPLHCVSDWPVEAACGVTYPGVMEMGGFAGSPVPCRVAEAEEWFARLCRTADEILGEPAACRWFLNWFDETPREEMRRLLLAEVQDNLERRKP